MGRIRNLALVTLAGAAVGAVVARLRRTTEAPAPAVDDRADELRRKLDEARTAAETTVEDPPRAEPEPEPEPEPPAEPEPEPPAEPEPEPPAEQAPPPAPGAGEAPPQDEFEAMRRRIHVEGKAAAEEMRRSADPEQPDQR